jgi:hypothetical protein
MADIQVPSIATATPAAADTVLGIKSGELKRFAVSGLALETAKTITGSGPLEFGATLTVSNEIAAPGGNISVGRANIFDYKAGTTTTGHSVAGIDWYKKTGAYNPNAAICHEAKFDNETTGTVTYVTAYEGQLSSNAGAVTAFTGHQSRITDNAGTIGAFLAYTCEVAQTGSTEAVYGYVFPDMSGVPNITTKRAVLNSDPNAPIVSAGAVIDQSIQYATPSASGFTVDILANRSFLMLNQAGDYAEGTLNLPAVATIVDGQEIVVSSVRAVTTLTIGNGGASFVLGAPTSLTSGGFFRLRFNSATSGWFRVG